MIFPNTVMNTMASIAAIAIGAKAPSITVNQATLAGDLAVARGARLIADGRADAVVAGGVDELFEDVYRRLSQMGALSPMRSRRAGGLPPVRAGSQRPGAGRGRDVPRARGARGRAGPGRAHRGRDRGDGLGQRADRAAHRRRPARRPRLAGRPAAPRPRFRGLRALLRSGQRRPRGDDWERALLTRDFGRLGRACCPPIALAPLFGQHGGLGALRVGAAALDAERGRPRCWCTALREAAAAPPWWWSRRGERRRERCLDRGAGLQRGGHHRRHRGARAAAWAVLVVDDGSTDGTGARARAAGAEVIALGARRGKGAALRCGFEAARRGAARVVTLDGDGQHEPDEIPRLLKVAVEEPDALVIGGRLAGLAEPRRGSSRPDGSPRCGWPASSSTG